MNNSKIKIVLFSDTFCDANGVSRFLQDMSKEAKKDNKEFYVVTSTAKNYCDKLDTVKILKPIVKIKMPFYKDMDLVIPPYFKMKKIVQEINPDVIHISTPGLVGISGIRIAKKLDIPLVGTYHTDFPEYIYKNTKSKFFKDITQRYLKFFYKDFKSIITRSKEYIEVIENDIKIPKKDIHFLQPGTNIDTFSKDFKDDAIWDELDIDSDALKFLYVGRATKEKNLDMLFDIWKEFYKKSMKKNSYLLIVGSGDLLKYKDELEKFNIKFLGYKQKEELSTIYASSSIFVFPSTTDTLGQVVLESMASGTPTIVTTKGGPQGIVSGSEKEVGFICDIDDLGLWVNTLVDIEEGKISLENLSQNAYEYSQNFSISNTFKSFYKINSTIRL